MISDKGDIGMSKYIIKNCPAFLDDVQLLEFSEGTCNSLQNHRKHCQDCTDCVMKQIVELCKNVCIDCSNIKRVTYTQCKDLNNCKTAKILQLLDIQECE